jgi:hypothetical protein
MEVKQETDRTVQHIQKLAAFRRAAPVELISFPSDAAQRFIDQHGRIDLSFKDLTLIRFPTV